MAKGEIKLSLRQRFRQAAIPQFAEGKQRKQRKASTSLLSKKANKKESTTSNIQLSGRQRLLQHRLNIFRGKEWGNGGASFKPDAPNDAHKTKMARRNKARRRARNAKKRADKEKLS